MARIAAADNALVEAADLALMLEAAGDDLKNLVVLVNELDKAIAPFSGKLPTLSAAIDKTRLAAARIGGGGIIQAIKQRTGLANDVFRIIAFASGVANGFSQLDTVIKAMIPENQRESGSPIGKILAEGPGDMNDPFPNQAQKNTNTDTSQDKQTDTPVTSLQQAAQQKFGPGGVKQFAAMIKRAFQPNANVFKIVGLGPNALKMAGAQAVLKGLPFVDANKVALEVMALSPKEAMQLAASGNVISQHLQTMVTSAQQVRPEDVAAAKAEQAPQADSGKEQTQAAPGQQQNTPVGVFKGLLAKETGKNISDKAAQRFLDLAQQALKAGVASAPKNTPEIPDLK